MIKPWYCSKTLWVNILAGAATVAGAFGIDVGLGPTEQAQIVAGVMVVVNVALRFVTKTAIR
tara:strand:+ start:2182 stop:2367 length:186 start_codon:yes stop_codon:yes gene_type:complete